MNLPAILEESSWKVPGHRRIGREALRALYAELVLYPKPGLVSPVDSGSHRDMDAVTFLRSLFSLRSYFGDIAAAAAADAPFPRLQELGRAAEVRMLKATGDVNTHRGAIFTLGLLAAAAAYLEGQGQPLSDRAMGETVRERWGGALRGEGCALVQPSHGALAARCYGAGGARAEAAAGFPLLFEVAFPTLRSTLATTGSPRRSLVQTLFALMASLEDTNLLYRGGPGGLSFVRRSAGGFLASGGVLAPGWEGTAVAIHRAFIARRLSPGGSADLLAAAWFVHRLPG